MLTPINTPTHHAHTHIHPHPPCSHPYTPPPTMLTPINTPTHHAHTHKHPHPPCSHPYTPPPTMLTPPNTAVISIPTAVTHQNLFRWWLMVRKLSHEVTSATRKHYHTRKHDAATYLVPPYVHMHYITRSSHIARLWEVGSDQSIPCVLIIMPLQRHWEETPAYSTRFSK